MTSLADLRPDVSGPSLLAMGVLTDAIMIELLRLQIAPMNAEDRQKVKDAIAANIKEITDQMVASAPLNSKQNAQLMQRQALKFLEVGWERVDGPGG